MAFAVLCALANFVWADEITVLAGGAARHALEPVAATLQGHKVSFDFQTMGRLQQSLAAGQKADLVVVSSEVLERLEKDGKVPAGRGTPLARVGIGVAVHEKAPLPDISTPEAMRRTLLAAKSIVYINPKTGTSGKYVEDMLSKLDILGDMKSKTTLIDEGYAVAPVGRGEVELGIHQISEIIPVPGVKLVGELPAQFQRYTVYVAVPLNESKAVKDFIAHATGPQARERLARAGYTSP
ncbi:MAG TPA: substrate-binding domain-containing protein [Burkholderiales bacterium]|jgi:molybdate transport system substrate-binding protein|nr:substrate-binding domain-containing protein [Burkholderiales bacterium]